MKIKVSEATNIQLDWMVANAQHLNIIQVKGGVTYTSSYPKIGGAPYSPTTDWAQGGPIIERESLSLTNRVYSDTGIVSTSNLWRAMTDHSTVEYGPTPLIAAMRCYVTSELGDTIEVPDGLGE